MLKQEFLTKEIILERFWILQRYKPDIRYVEYARINNIPDLNIWELFYLPEGKIKVITNSDAYEVNEISDYFNEKYRLLAKRYDEDVSPAEFYANNQHKIEEEFNKKFDINKIPNPAIVHKLRRDISDMLLHNPRSLMTKHISARQTYSHQLGTQEKIPTPKRVLDPGDPNLIPKLRRDVLFNMTHEAATFRPTDLVSLIHMFNSKRILDPCMGWGDRLIASLAMKVEVYCGTDPNSDLHPGYEKIRDTFAYETQTYFIDSPFETADIPDLKYDLIFTSPPYADLEIYTSLPGQSSQYVQFEDWFNKFLMVSLRKAWKFLQPGGRMCININDIRDKQKICQRMVQEMHDVPDCIYEGPIMFSTWNMNHYKSFQPIWTWKKVALNPDPDIHLIAMPATPDHPDYLLVQDADLPGGTKQRAIGAFRDLKCSEIVYAGPHNGLAQVAIGIFGKLLGYKATMFTDAYNDPASHRAMMYGTKFKIIPGPLQEVQAAAKEYCADKPDVYFAEFGFSTPEFKSALQDQLVAAFKRSYPSFLETEKRIWLVSGSTTLLHVLYKVFPKAKFCIVQVGKTIYLDQYNQANTQLFVSNEQFYTIAEVQPEYDTIPSYDAKLFKYFTKHGISGDIIWNVAGFQQYSMPERRYPVSDTIWNAYMLWDLFMKYHTEIIADYNYYIYYTVMEIQRCVNAWVCECLENNWFKLLPDAKTYNSGPRQALQKHLAGLWFLSPDQAEKFSQFRTNAFRKRANTYWRHGIASFVYEIPTPVPENILTQIQLRMFVQYKFSPELAGLLTNFMQINPLNPETSKKPGSKWMITALSGEYVKQFLTPGDDCLIISRTKIPVDEELLAYHKSGIFKVYITGPEAISGHLHYITKAPKLKIMELLITE